ncbi:Abi family protein [Silanimonas sp.]|jgi:abortive infection bacteriophage resistance protein|uniref:Abi family protein n=1 Tax=Silanimonas sp. TaxID=1929290 RepID=UPI0037C6B803
MSYEKPWKSYSDQLDQLIARGLGVTDRSKALDCLERIGYYRLSGYWFAFRQRSAACVVLGSNGRKPERVRVESLALDDFKPGASFQAAVDLYVFDKRLRLLALDALERIEVALRVDVSHTLGKLDPFAHLNPELLHECFSQKVDQKTGLTPHHQWLARQAQLTLRSKEEFVRHHRQRYGLPMAVWVACELWDFGALSTLYGGLRQAEQDAIAQRYGIDDGRVFASWLRCLNYLRNVCAHHSRLWNRNMVDQPKLPPVSNTPWLRHFKDNSHALARCYLPLCLTRALLRTIHPQSTWASRVEAQLGAFPSVGHLGLDLGGMGAPPDWSQHWASVQ